MKVKNAYTLSYRSQIPNNVNSQERNQNNIIDRNGTNISGEAAATDMSNPVIIMEPDESCRKEFFANPFNIYRLLQNTPLNNNNILGTTRNLRRNVQTFKLKSNNNMKEILAMQTIGTFKIKCYEPFSQKIKIGLIGPIELKMTEEQVVELLVEEGYNIVKAERLIVGKGDTKRTTKTMKIYMEQHKLPEEVIFMWEKFKVTPFIERPWQCYKCQKFGHSAPHCPNKIKCLICSGPHKFQDCINKENKKCSNCGGNHTSSYGGCERMKVEVKIQKIRAQNNISYRDAVMTHYKENKESSTMIARVTNTDPKRSLQQSGGDVQRGANEMNYQHKENTTRVSVGVQTMIEEEKVEINKRITSTNEENSKLACCILEIVSHLSKADSVTKKISLISKAFETHLGLNLREEDLQQVVKNTLSSKIKTAFSKQF